MEIEQAEVTLKARSNSSLIIFAITGTQRLFHGFRLKVTHGLVEATVTWRQRGLSSVGRHADPMSTLQHWDVWEGLVPGEISLADQHWGDGCHFYDLASMLSGGTSLQKALGVRDILKRNQITKKVTGDI